MLTGTVAMVNGDKGYGFIRPDDKPKDSKKDLFFHISGMTNRDDFDSLKVNDRVTYEVCHDDERPKAENIRLSESG